MGFFFNLTILTIFYYVALFLLQRNKVRQLKVLQKEVIGKTKNIHLAIPAKEEIFGSTSQTSNDMQAQKITTPSIQQLTSRETLFKGTISDRNTTIESNPEQSIVQQTVQQIIEGTSLANQEMSISPIQEGLELLAANNKFKDSISLKKVDFIPIAEQDKDMQLLYSKDIPQLMDYHKRPKK